MTGEALALLDRAVEALPGAEQRPGQQRMAAAVAACLAQGTHAVVQAGTGTGKSLAYLVPVIASGRQVLVVTATKALQDQLARKDLPFLAALHGVDVDFAVLKGRSNYLCRQRLDELAGQAQPQLELEGVTALQREQIAKLAAWSAHSLTGDIADLDWSPASGTWRAVSVSSDECPGRTRCPRGHDCFAEAARERAAAAQVIIVNMHLFGLDVSVDGAILPAHDAVVIDEAHLLEDVVSDTVGVTITPGQFRAAAALLGRILDEPELSGAVGDAGQLAHGRLLPAIGRRLRGGDAAVEWLAGARSRLDQALGALGRIDSTGSDELRQRRLRAQNVIGSLATAIDAIHAALDAADGSHVLFVAGSQAAPRLVLAPLDVAAILRQRVWSRRPAVLTSATLPASVARRVGLEGAEVLDVGSPFEYRQHALLYCAAHLPDPRADDYRPKLHDELSALITAAGGRTLALFTSWRAMRDAAVAVADRLEVPILSQGDLPKPALLAAFADDESTCLFATVGLFQGVDVPGRTLSLVTIDRLPFPRPDDPLLQARRELVGDRAFVEIDVPRAAMLLAQASGRLIRTATDRGVVAVFDRRLAHARYRWELVDALPPMQRTRNRHDAEVFLDAITTTALSDG